MARILTLCRWTLVNVALYGRWGRRLGSDVPVCRSVDSSARKGKPVWFRETGHYHRERENHEPNQQDKFTTCSIREAAPIYDRKAFCGEKYGVQIDSYLIAPA